MPRAQPSTDPGPAPPSEIELLSAAQRALGSSPAETLRLAEEHRRLYRGGMHAQEREVLAIDALLRLDRRPEALERANAFLGRHARSAHARRVRVLLSEAGL